jgi:hypothetical protein
MNTWMEQEGVVVVQTSKAPPDFQSPTGDSVILCTWLSVNIIELKYSHLWNINDSLLCLLYEVENVSTT